MASQEAPPGVDPDSVEWRNLRIWTEFETYIVSWTAPTFRPSTTFVRVVLTLVEGCQRPSDGSPKPDIQSQPSKIDAAKLLKDILASHGKRDYQWIFDNFWGSQIIDQEALKKIIDQYSAQIEPLLNDYIAQKAPLPFWQPDKKTKNYEFLRSLHIPMLHGGPDMLLHGLGRFEKDPILQSRVEPIFHNNIDQHTVVMNTSGSGKTRLSVEGLCQFWGIYFTSSVDSQGHGSVDLQNTIEALERDGDFTPMLPETDYEALHERNCAIARSRFAELVYARFVIFEQFCLLAKESSSGKLLDEHRRYWVLLQLKPRNLGGPWDVFAELTSRIKGSDCPQHPLASRINAVAERVRLLIRGSDGPKVVPLFCVLDEAQSAARKYLGAYLSRRFLDRILRPILREIVAACVAVIGLWLIVAGTGMSKTVVQEAMASAIAKGKSYKTYHDVGGFHQGTAQINYMKSLMPDSFKDTPEARNLLKLAHYWLRGRFRFTAALMGQLLLSGFQDSEVVLQQYIYAATAPQGRLDEHILSSRGGFTATGGSLDRLIGKPPERIVKGLTAFKFERLKAHERLFTTIKILISKCYMRGSIGIELTDSEFDAVEYGFARFAPRNAAARVDSQQRPFKVVLDEPLVLLALEQWLGEKDLPIHEGLSLRARLGEHSASGSNGLEEYFAFYLSTVFNDDTPLTSIFRFDPAQIPDWAKKPAKLVSLYNRERPWDRDPGRIQDELESGRVTQASRPSVSLGIGKDVKKWLDHRSEAPFLFPDTNMGPDIMFVLELSDEARSRIWVAVQSKYSDETLLVKPQLESALRSVTPQRFYLGNEKGPPHTPKEKEAAKEREGRNKETLPLLKALPRRLEKGAGTYSLLRVVAAWKSRINLHERGAKDNQPPPPPPQDPPAGRYASRSTRNEHPTHDVPPAKPKSKLDWYSDSQRHPVVELDIEYMARQIQMLHPQENPDFSHPDWLSLPFTRSRAEKRRTKDSTGNRPKKRRRVDPANAATDNLDGDDSSLPTHASGSDDGPDDALSSLSTLSATPPPTTHQSALSDEEVDDYDRDVDRDG
ncbi:hypothetical protein C8R47DRAFT_358486 [Mycena vitilis]|nr:hypothetical protein C8R47DRAFT_358486 [Mycena vitilis]